MAQVSHFASCKLHFSRFGLKFASLVLSKTILTLQALSSIVSEKIRISSKYSWWYAWMPNFISILWLPKLYNLELVIPRAAMSVGQTSA
jgi:hypothetical protein